METKEQEVPLNILLADDDIDDRLFFDKALKELPISTRLTTVHDGEELMNYLLGNLEQLPHIIFLDLNMPRKNGFECLTEIKENNKLKDISVVMFSTSYPRDMNYEKSMIELLYQNGANDFIRKPQDFEQLKKVVHTALLRVMEKIA